MKYKFSIRWLYFGTLVWALHHYWHFTVEIKYVKYRLLSKHLVRRKQQYGGWKNHKVTTNFGKKNVFQLPHGIKKMEASCIYDLHIGEIFFLQPLLLKFFGSFRFEQSNKTWSVLWSVWVFFVLIEQTIK